MSPTYDNRCSACKHTFETFQSMSAPKVKKCPKCGKLKVKRMVGKGAGIIFKGTGFYETDYKQKENKAKLEREKKQNGQPDAKNK
jgi:putative FmdB family regulatory protein